MVLHGDTVACALEGPGGTKPVYASPGHLCDVPTAARLCRAYQVHRVPEPTRRAHILVTSERG